MAGAGELRARAGIPCFNVSCLIFLYWRIVFQISKGRPVGEIA